MILRTIIILLLALPGFADSRIVSVSIYPGWAEVTRSVTAAGPTAELTLPAWVDLDSIQARGPAIVATHKRLETTPPLTKKEREAREKAIDAIRKELTEAAAKHSLLAASTKTQRDYFAKLMDWKLGAPPQEMTTRRFTDAEFAEFVKFRDVLADLDSREYESQREQAAIQERLAEAEKALKETLAKKSSERVLVSIDLQQAAAPVSFTLAYRIPGATWHPTTEIKPVGNALQLNRRALIRQVTSEDWADAAITLRSSQLGDASALYAKIAASAEPDENGESPLRQSFARFDASNGVAQEIAEFATLLGEHREHRLADPATVLSGGAAVRLDIDSANLPLSRIYSLNAQKRSSGWIKGEVTPARNELLGPLSVSVAEPFTVQWANVAAADDVLSLPLGEEPKVTIRRSLVREASSVPRTSGEEQWLDLSYRLTVRNELAESATIIVDEPLPAGKVTLLASNPQVEDRKGALRWHLQLGSGETATFEYAIRWAYSVKDRPALATILERALR